MSFARKSLCYIHQNVHFYYRYFTFLPLLFINPGKTTLFRAQFIPALFLPKQSKPTGKKNIIESRRVASSHPDGFLRFDEINQNFSYSSLEPPSIKLIGGLVDNEAVIFDTNTSAIFFLRHQSCRGRINSCGEAAVFQIKMANEPSCFCLLGLN